VAGAPLTAPSVPPERELKAFSRLAGRLLLTSASRGAGVHAVRRRRGPGLEPIDHRDYQPGDDLRRVDWRQTARAGRPIVREFRAESSYDWLVCVDGSASMAVADASGWRRAVEIGAGIAYALLDLGHRVGLRVLAAQPLVACSAGRGAAHYARLARMLASYAPPARGGTTACGTVGSTLAGHPALFVVGDFLPGAAWEREFALLARLARETHAVQLATPLQTRLPDVGAVELVDVETGARRSVRSDGATAAAAAAEAAAQTARLQLVAARLGIRFSAASCRQTWQRTLLKHLAGPRR
jgi:uncharacterized protein (DUF58 family)